MPRVPVLAQCCGCCQVVVNWYWMLCHTQYIRNQAWNEQWSGTASAVCLCPLPTSSVQPLGWDWEPPWVFSALMCSLKEVRIPPQPKEFCWFPQLAGVCHWSWLWGVSELCIGVQWNVQLYIYGLQTWTHSLLPIPVWHLLPAVGVFLWCQLDESENAVCSMSKTLFLHRCAKHPWWYCGYAINVSCVCNFHKFVFDHSSQTKSHLGNIFIPWVLLFLRASEVTNIGQ